MGLIERIKSALGLSTSASQPGPDTADRPTPGESTDGEAPPDEGVDVTVEHAPATESEDAVKGTDTAAETVSTDTDEPAAADAASEDSEAESGAEHESEAEPESEVDASEPEADASEPEAEPESEVEDDTETETGADASHPSDPDADLEEITGIGPTYADRLREAGIADIGALAAADAADLAERADVPASRVEDWVERAGAF